MNRLKSRLGIPKEGFSGLEDRSEKIRIEHQETKNRKYEDDEKVQHGRINRMGEAQLEEVMADNIPKLWKL